MSASEKTVADALTALCARQLGGAPSGLTRLAGGANCEMWAFRIGAKAYVLRKGAAGREQMSATGSQTLAQREEARLLQAVQAHAPRVPVAPIIHICTPEEGLGDSFIMGWLEGESIARKILRDAPFAAVRPKLAAQCGEVLAHIHACPLKALPASLARAPAPVLLEHYAQLLAAHDHPHPVLELALHWLRQNLPPSGKPCLVHGDFRHGNLMVDARRGLSAVLDWELSHIGDGLEDLGWLCVPSWRFGALEHPVGGFGEYDALLDAYQRAGGVCDRRSLRFWEIFGTFKWGIICTQMGDAAAGMGYALERAAVGRRVSETEMDLLVYLEEEIQHAG